MTIDGEMVGTTPAHFVVLPQSLTVVADYNQVMSAQGKLLGLPGIDIIDKEDFRNGEITLAYSPSVDLMEVLSREFLKVGQSAIVFWHSLVTANHHSSDALLRFAGQTFYEMTKGIDQVIDLVMYSTGVPLPPSANDSVDSTVNKSTICTPIRVVHQTAGRVRFQISRLETDVNYAERLRSLLQSVWFVQEVQINPLAASIAIQFDPGLSLPDVVQHLLNILHQLD